MQNLFDCWQHIKAELQTSSRVLLLLDYDGTLVPIVKDPAQAVPGAALRPLLRKLGCAKKIILGIITGRSLKDIRSRIGLRGIIYAGNHGLEISAGSRGHMAPGFQRHLKDLQHIASALSEEVKKVPGALLENKRLTLSIHYRRCTMRDARRLKTLVSTIISPWRDSIRIVRGKKVWDLQPPIDWNKGRAATWILQQFMGPQTPLPIYIGDDRTDEDVFRALGPNAITVRVRKRKDSAAAYYLAGVSEVTKCLNLLTQL
jgi:trehalose 6-phosphate phosphatase